MQNGTIFEKSQNIFLKRGGVMAYLSDDELLDTEGGFTGWDDGTGAGAEETLEQALAEERLAELESELEQDEHPIDYEAELEDEEEEAASVSDKRLKREMRAEAIRRLEEAARTEKDFRAVVEEWNKLDRNCALPGFVDSKNEEKTERNAGYLVVSHSGGGMLRQGTRKGIRRTPANRGMRAHRIVKSLDISEDVCHGLCP